MSVADQPEDVLDSGEAGGRAIRGGALFTGTYVIGLLLSIASVPFMIRHLGVVDYGYYVAVSAIVFIIGGFTEAGLTNLGIREYSQLRPGEREPFLRNLIGLRLVLTTFGVVVATALTAVTGSPGIVVGGVAITGFGLLVQLTQQTYTVPLNAQLRMGWISILGVIRQATLSGLFILLVVLNAGLTAFFWANVAMGVVLVTVTLLVLRGTAPLLPSFHVRSWKRILVETLPIALAAAVGLIYFRIAVVLMSYVSTDTETGIFSAAFRIVEVVGVLPWMLVSAGFPILARAARDDEARLGYALQKMFEVANVLGAFVAMGLAIAAPFAIEVVAGKGFNASVSVLRLQSCGLLTSFLMVTWTYALVSLRLYRPLLWANALAAVTAIVATLVLAPPLGAEGAAIATVAAEAALAGGALYGLRSARPALTPSLGVVPKVSSAWPRAWGPRRCSPSRRSCSRSRRASSTRRSRSRCARCRPRRSPRCGGRRSLLAHVSPPGRRPARPQRQRLGPAAARAADGRVRRLGAPDGLQPASGRGARAADRAGADAARLAARGRAAGAAAYALGERYLGLRDQLAGADVVHAAEIGTWFSAQAAKLKRALGFRLVLTVWETIAWRDAYRWPRERALPAGGAAGGRPLPGATERARDALLLEGVPADRVEVCAAGDRPGAVRGGSAGRGRLRAVGGAAGVGEGAPGRAARVRAAARDAPATCGC